MTQKTVLVVDDHDLFCAGIALILHQNLPDANIMTFAGLGEAIDGSTGSPDLLLLDYRLKGIGGDAGIALARSCWPETPVIVVTAETDPRLHERVRAMPNVRLLSKAAAPEALVALVREVLPHAEMQQPMGTLSARQLEILQLMREGHSNKAIARKIGLSEFTVRGHVQRILRVTGACNRTGAVFLAEQSGLI